MMPRGAKRLSGDVMLHLFDLEADSDFRPEIIRLQVGSSFQGNPD
jgi:hypothetical protein